MNPTVPQHVVDRALEEDHAKNTAEYLAQFRSDIEGFVSIEVVEECVGDYRELPPVAGTRYGAYVDPAGGGPDSYCMAIAHKTKDDVVYIDCIRERRPPFSPEDVVNEFVPLLKTYGISKIFGDGYAAEFSREPYKKFGITYEKTDKDKSTIYRSFLPLLNSKRVVLPRNERLINQLVGLERTVSRGGKDTISHARHAHDDIANAAAGAAVHATKSKYDPNALVGLWR